ncbi:hypothetical protein [Thermosporothrix hazakensis]|nr:hypothetical protein [Thermosporothrix hazakensis]
MCSRWWSRGDYGFYALCSLLFYRFPACWAAPFALIGMVALLLGNGGSHMQAAFQWSDLANMSETLLLALLLIWGGGVQRSRYFLVVRLQEVQEQLRQFSKLGARDRAHLILLAQQPGLV